jgi:hypothetical protein
VQTSRICCSPFHQHSDGWALHAVPTELFPLYCKATNNLSRYNNMYYTIQNMVLPPWPSTASVVQPLPVCYSSNISMITRPYLKEILLCVRLGKCVLLYVRHLSTTLKKLMQTKKRHSIIFSLTGTSLPSPSAATTAATKCCPPSPPLYPLDTHGHHGNH